MGRRRAADNTMLLDENRIIIETRSGSHAYGTNIESSDEDFRGIYIPTKEYFLGFAKTFEQFEFKEPHDRVLYDIRKYFKLAVDANPNILEICWCRDEDIIRITKLGEKLRAHGELFLSKRCRFSYAGYAHSQILRIKRHKSWLLNPPKKKPERKDYGLPENRRLVPRDWVEAISQSDLTKDENKISEVPEELIDAARREKSFKDAMEHWQHYSDWKETRNPKRAELEAKHFFDTKHGSHVLRLLISCIEILEGKGLIVYRPDRDYLKAVRNGLLTYDELLEEADKLDKRAEELYQTSTLRHTPDINFLDALCVEIVEEELNIK